MSVEDILAEYNAGEIEASEEIRDHLEAEAKFAKCEYEDILSRRVEVNKNGVVTAEEIKNAEMEAHKLGKLYVYSERALSNLRMRIGGENAE